MLGRTALPLHADRKHHSVAVSLTWSTASCALAVCNSNHSQSPLPYLTYLKCTGAEHDACISPAPGTTLSLTTANLQ